MREIESNLPLLGNVRIHFFKESSLLLDLFKKDFDRLNEISHLGVASKVFTGVNHTRLEYCLLQCAIIKVVTKLFKHIEGLSVSNDVDLPGISKKISSGEELIKCWIIILNLGHTNYTFGVERILLRKCIEDKEFREKIFEEYINREYRKWANRIVDNYIYEDFFKVLALVQINQISNRKTKGFYRQIFKSLVFPIDEIKFKDYHQKEKIVKLRTLFERIRMLSQIAIDSFYSHLPVEFKLNQSIINLDQIISSKNQDLDYKKLYASLGAFLAKEIYLHPRAIAITMKYEREGLKKLEAGKWKTDFSEFLRNVRTDGFGEPSIRDWRVFLRITLTRNNVTQRNLYATIVELEKCIGKKHVFQPSIFNNRFNTEQYLDISFDASKAKLYHLLKLIHNLYGWFMGKAEKEADKEVKRYKRMILGKMNPALKNYLKEIRLKSLDSGVSDFKQHGVEIIKSVIRQITEKKYRVEVVCPDQLVTIGIKISYPNGGSFNDIEKVKDSYLKYYDGNADRKQEINGVYKEYRKLNHKFTIVCFSNIILTNIDGNKEDEWDGVILSIGQSDSVLQIIEVKNRGNRSEQEAFNQLKQTKLFLSHNVVASMRRRRIKKIGAVLELK